MKNWLIILLLVLAFFPTDIYSQIPDTLRPQKKTALVIGNGNYPVSVLSNPENDARAMAGILKKLGFEVFEYENLTQNQMKRAIDEFGLRLFNNSVGLFYYAGHGVQFKGFNYLIPVDAQLKTEEDVEFDCVEANRVLAKMEASGSKVNIIILDACRNNPFERSWSRSATGRGLAFMDAPGGTLIAYSTALGRTASDGSGNNSPYTSAILESIQIPGITINQMFQNVARLVSQKSNNQQVPWISSSLTADFYFNYGEIAGPAIQEKIVYPGSPDRISSKPDYPKINGPDDWQMVEVLENKPDLSGLTEVKKIKAKSLLGGNSGSQMGLNNCIRDLKKKAAELGCPVVVITDKKLGLTTNVEGIAYKVKTEN
jgi:hypothetical protein